LTGWVEACLALTKMTKIPRRKQKQKQKKALGSGIQTSPKVWRYVFFFSVIFFSNDNGIAFLL